MDAPSSFGNYKMVFAERGRFHIISFCNKQANQLHVEFFKTDS